MRHFVVATLDELLAEGQVAHCPYERSFEDGASDPFFVIHTSGSTGLPKPITVCQGGLATIDAHHMKSTLDGYESQLKVSEGPTRVFNGFPLFHVS